MPVNQTPADLTSTPDQRPYAGIRYILDLVLMLRAWPGQVLAVLLMMVLQLGFALLFPVALRSLFDDAVAGRDLELLLRILVAIGGGFLLSSAAGVMQDYLLSRTTARAVQALRRRIFEHLLDLSSPDIQRFGTGDLLSRFANDVSAVDAAVSRGLPLAGFNIILALSSLGLLFVIEWRLALLAAAALPFLLIGPRIFGARAARYSAIKKRIEARVLEHARVAVEGERTIRAARLRPRVLSEYRRDSDALRRAGVRVSYFGALLGRTSLLSVLLLMLLIIGLGSVLSIQGLLSTGLLLAFIGLLLNIQEAALGMAEAAPIVTAAYGGMRRAQALLATEPSVRDVALPTELAPLRDLLRVEDLSFSYEAGAPPVLCDVNLEVPRGAIVAVVGPSGSGKSTLIDLLLRLRLADSGRVLYDGRDLQLASSVSLQRQMTAVFQHETLLPGTVRDNIEVGDGAGANAADAAPATAETAARLAGVNTLIESMPNGYATIVGLGRRQVSGGQRQCIALARAWALRTPVLLLDEATSAMDPATEAAALEALHGARGERTVVMVTHRLEPVREADAVVVLEGGRVVQQGSHDELVRAAGLYRELWRKQSGISLSGDGHRATVSTRRLRDLPLLAGLARRHVTAINNALTTRTFAEGEEVIAQGAQGRAFYIIARGKVEVRATSATGEERNLAQLETGDYFGEISLLTDQPTTASVVAVTRTVCLVLSRDDFRQLLDEAPALRRAIEPVMEERRRNVTSALSPEGGSQPAR